MIETPICNALLRHVQGARGPLHVPGHQMGSVLPDQLNTWFGQAAKFDLTELPGLDNLAQPEECILQSEELAAKHYGSAQCLYSVNGSSAGVMAALLATAKNDATVLFLNPFHISAWYGLIHSGSTPLLLPTRFTETWRQSAIDLRLVDRMLTAHPEISAVYVTSPTYQGDCADVAQIAALVHSRGLPLIVDEAHGAHFGLIPEFPQSSVKAGADIVVQSVHKMLPGLTQTAWVHSQGGLVDANRLADALRSLQTSSPSYLLLASMDAVQYWLRSEGPVAARTTLQKLDHVGLYHRSPTQALRDPLKHWVPAARPEHARTLNAMLQSHGLYTEYSDDTGVLSILGLQIRTRVLAEYVHILAEWQLWVDQQAAKDDGEEASESSRAGDWEQISRVLEGSTDFRVLPRDSVQLQQVRVPLAQAVHCTAASPVIPYPPGIPVLYPGQRLQEETVDVLRMWFDTGRKVQGIYADGTISVLR